MCAESQAEPLSRVWAKTRVLKHDSYNELDAQADMEFRLSYDGELLGASQNRTRAPHKHAIRKYFHRQLKRLWEATPALQKLGYWSAITSPFEQNYSVAQQTADNHQLGKYRFLPLATRDLDLIVGLDILPPQQNLWVDSGSGRRPNV
jgi:hypothetical protein